MKEYEVEIEGHRFSLIAKRQAAGEFSFLINGKEIAGRFTKSNLNAEIEIGDERYRITLETGKTPRILVDGMAHNARLISVRHAVTPEPRESLHIPSLTQTPTGKLSVGATLSPMPGKVLAVNVKEGDKVKVGEPLLLLEAMKMENELGASSAGVVSRIFVKPGSIVKKDEPLLLIT